MDKRIGNDDGLVLLLSGGGFRATLFHLGVLYYLCQSRLLGNLRYVASVSGGSIAAAHLLQHFEDYKFGTPSFVARARQVMKFAQRDVRGRILRRRLGRLLIEWLVFPVIIAGYLFRIRLPSQRLTDLIITEFETLYGKKASLGTASGAPYGDMLTCSLTTGEMCLFSKGSFRAGASKSPIRHTDLSLSLAVACSAAFPPLFPPIRIDAEALGATRMQFPHAEYLSDGGVYENTGIRLPLAMISHYEINAKYIFVSDASRKSDYIVDEPFISPVKRTIRVTDLMMDRISDLEYEVARTKYPNLTFIRTRMSEEITHPMALPHQDQRALASLRTDLNSFSEHEMTQLIADGYTHARDAFQKEGFVIDMSEPFMNFFPSAKTHDLRRGSNTPVNLWNWKDWYSYLDLVLLCSCIFEGLWLISLITAAFHHWR